MGRGADRAGSENSEASWTIKGATVAATGAAVYQVPIGQRKNRNNIRYPCPLVDYTSNRKAGEREDRHRCRQKNAQVRLLGVWSYGACGAGVPRRNNHLYPRKNRLLMLVILEPVFFSTFAETSTEPLHLTTAATPALSPRGVPGGYGMWTRPFASRCGGNSSWPQ